MISLHILTAILHNDYSPLFKTRAFLSVYQNVGKQTTKLLPLNLVYYEEECVFFKLWWIKCQQNCQPWLAKVYDDENSPSVFSVMHDKLLTRKTNVYIEILFCHLKIVHTKEFHGQFCSNNRIKQIFLITCTYYFNR